MANRKCDFQAMDEKPLTFYVLCDHLKYCIFNHRSRSPRRVLAPHLQSPQPVFSAVDTPEDLSSPAKLGLLQTSNIDSTANSTRQYFFFTFRPSSLPPSFPTCLFIPSFLPVIRKANGFALRLFPFERLGCARNRHRCLAS